MMKILAVIVGLLCCCLILGCGDSRPSDDEEEAKKIKFESTEPNS